MLDVPYREPRSVRFSQPRTFMDYSWLPASLETREGEKLEVRVFSLYAGSWRHEEPKAEQPRPEPRKGFWRKLFG